MKIDFGCEHTSSAWRNVYGSEDDPLMDSAHRGFDDLGYHELTDAEHGFLRHEMLFASGAEICIEFKKVIVRRTRFVWVTSRADGC